MTEKTEEVKTEGEVKEPEKAQDKKEPEKTLTQSEVNALMAKERKSYEAKLKAVQDEYATFKKSIEDKAAEAETAAKEKVEKLREGLPEGITNLLDKLTAVEQLEWLSDPANTLEHKTIKPLPEPNIERARLPSIGTIV
jgi:molecular chaperone GrpE (heat shock protein)